VWKPYSTWSLKLTSYGNTEASSSNFHINTLIDAYRVVGRWAGRSEERLTLFGLNLEQALCNKSWLWVFLAFNDVAIWIFPRTPQYVASCLTVSHKLYLQLYTTFLEDAAKYTARHLQRYFSIPTVKTFFTSLHKDIRSRDNVFGIATSYGLDNRGVAVRAPVG
jgi:hypothetical protein